MDPQVERLCSVHLRGAAEQDGAPEQLQRASVEHAREVRAVVLETTGDISVLHGDPDGPPLETPLLTGVRDAGRVETVEAG